MNQKAFGQVNKSQNYETPDLPMAALISIYLPLEGVVFHGGPKAQFVFKYSAELDRLIEGYWHGDLLVEPKTYFNALRVIKARLYQ